MRNRVGRAVVAVSVVLTLVGANVVLSPGPASQASAMARVQPPKLIRPGKALPTGESCRDSVRSKPEIRADNADENAFVPVDGTDYSLVPWTLDSFGMADAADTFRQRIDGNYTGTTDEILQWGACKWGFRWNVVRAIAVAESAWRMSKVGDLDKETPSYGIMQVKAAFHPTTAPASYTSTAFNVDYALGYIRACYEGYLDWLAQSFSTYGRGDFWGCIGHWFSGGWYDQGAVDYVADIKAHAKRKIWRSSAFDTWT